MRPPSELASYLEGLSPAELRAGLASFVPPNAPPAERIAAIESILNGPQGDAVRAAAGRWIADHIVPATRLVPSAHVRWVPVVRDAMLFVVSHLSAGRLAPKLLEQLELSSRTRAETRLLLLISKVPGLQKLGQVLARNRHLGASLRRALVHLENEIRDVKPSEIAALIRKRLGSRVEQFDVRFRPSLLSEASVSAIVRFTWINPATKQRERGVFKVLKPYIPEYFSEDMEMLQGLADYFGAKLDDYGLSGDVLSDTFTKVRRLLEHEVDFPGEQKTLKAAYPLYQSMPGVGVPRVITQLCTREITAMSEEQGTKITVAASHMSKWHRARLSEKLVEALVALPLLSAQNDALFHADPHAGNLFYDAHRKRILILDWALTERLTRDQRRHLALLFAFVALRDRVSVAREIEALRQNGRRNHRPSRFILTRVCEFLDGLPMTRLPSAVDAMHLLEQLAMSGTKFPSSLIMLSKVLLTLDGILGDLGASENCIGVGIARHIIRRLLADRSLIASPIKPSDWLAIECSFIMYLGRVWIKWEELLVELVAKARASEPVPQPSLS
jgi:ubiquinone biosynthesis protein